MRVEDCLPAFVARRVPERPEWVESNPRDPTVAGHVYGLFALAFSTLFFVLTAIVVVHPGAVLFVPVVVANAYAWTWSCGGSAFPRRESFRVDARLEPGSQSGRAPGSRSVP